MPRHGSDLLVYVGSLLGTAVGGPRLVIALLGQVQQDTIYYPTIHPLYGPMAAYFPLVAAVLIGIALGWVILAWLTAAIE